jgi:hypothetical protein
MWHGRGPRIYLGWNTTTSKAERTKARKKFQVAAKCGARREYKNGKVTVCKNAAGFGTNHPGTGACKYHGGTTPSHVKSAAKDQYRLLLGTPIEIDPIEAILTCIRIRAGEVQWLSDRMEELDRDAWVENTMTGKQFHLYARERQKAMQDLVRFAQIAISLGIAEKAVRLAETYGELLAQYTKGIIDELLPHLDEWGQKNWEWIVRQQLLNINRGIQAPIKTAHQMTALPERT